MRLLKDSGNSLHLIEYSAVVRTRWMYLEALLKPLLFLWTGWTLLPNINFERRSFQMNIIILREKTKVNSVPVNGAEISDPSKSTKVKAGKPTNRTSSSWMKISYKTYWSLMSAFFKCLFVFFWLFYHSRPFFCRRSDEIGFTVQ